MTEFHPLAREEMQAALAWYRESLTISVEDQEFIERAYESEESHDIDDPVEEEGASVE